MCKCDRIFEWLQRQNVVTTFADQQWGEAGREALGGLWLNRQNAAADSDSAARLRRWSMWDEDSSGCWDGPWGRLLPHLEFWPEVSLDLLNADKRALESKKDKVDTTSQYTRLATIPWSSETYTMYIYKYMPHSHVHIDHRTKVVLNSPTTREAKPSRREYYDYDDYVEVSRIIEFAWGH